MQTFKSIIEGSKEEYQKFFNKTLKKYGVTSPADLSDEEKKKFYDEIDAGWEGDNELEEGTRLAKKGDWELTADGKSSVGVQMAIRYKGKMLYPVAREKGKFIVGFPKGWIKNNSDKYDTSMVVFKAKGKHEFVSFDNAEDIIKFFSTKNITEAVSVDMRTKGYKEALARAQTRKEMCKKKKKSEKLYDEISNEDVMTGNVAMYPKPLKTLRRKK